MFLHNVSRKPNIRIKLLPTEIIYETPRDEDNAHWQSASMPC
jgi:hypothetical protein